MHPNPAFHKTPDETNLDFARERGFGTLSINGDDGPLIAHIPFVLSDDGKTADLHMLRSNPITRATDQPQSAVLAFPALTATSRPIGMTPMIRCPHGTTSPYICAAP